jgi:quercetin dioxygenase-like cupin family protein
MKVVSYKDIESKEVEGSSKLKIKWLNTGYSPHHNHPWEHEIFVLEGNGVVIGDKESKSISAGDSISIPADEIHQIKNPNKTPLRILCIIPK